MNQLKPIESTMNRMTWFLVTMLLQPGVVNAHPCPDNREQSRPQKTQREVLCDQYRNARGTNEQITAMEAMSINDFQWCMNRIMTGD